MSKKNVINDTYQTLKKMSMGEYKEKGSKFIAYTKAVYDEDAVKLFLEEVRKEHPKARHHCYAYRIGLDKQKNYRANDDGEPSGTAGRPILGQIDSNGLSNVMAIVVRYFGGTKLGVPGLIRSYKTATKDALENAEIEEKRLMKFFQLQFPYTQMNEVMRVVKRNNIEVQSQDYDKECLLNITIAAGDADGKLEDFNPMRFVKLKELKE
ncbi:MAG: YigZ family protein [Chitinophagales bacterium]